MTEAAEGSPKTFPAMQYPYPTEQQRVLGQMRGPFVGKLVGAGWYTVGMGGT
jgi:hypothetical protein